MIVYIQQIRVAGWIRVVLSWLLLYMGKYKVSKGVNTHTPVCTSYVGRGCIVVEEEEGGLYWYV